MCSLHKSKKITMPYVIHDMANEATASVRKRVVERNKKSHSLTRLLYVCQLFYTLSYPPNSFHAIFSVNSTFLPIYTSVLSIPPYRHYPPPLPTFQLRGCLVCGGEGGRVRQEGPLFTYFPSGAATASTPPQGHYRSH